MLFDALSRHARDRPDAPAVVCEASVLTWAQWREQALHLSATLPASGLVPLQYSHPQEFLVAVLACAHRGVSGLTLPSDTTSAERDRILSAAPPPYA